MPVYGQELTEELRPLKRGWGSLCARCKGNLLASARWIARCSRGCRESSSAWWVMEGDQPPHSGALVYDYGVPCGRITKRGLGTLCTAAGGDGAGKPQLFGGKGA